MGGLKSGQKNAQEKLNIIDKGTMCLEEILTREGKRKLFEIIQRTHSINDESDIIKLNSTINGIKEKHQLKKIFKLCIQKYDESVIGENYEQIFSIAELINQLHSNKEYYHYMIGMGSYYLKKYEQAIQHLEEVLRIKSEEKKLETTDTSDLRIIKLPNQNGQSSNITKENFQEFPKTELLPFVHYNLGVCYANLNDFKKSEEYFRISYGEFIKTESSLSYIVLSALAKNLATIKEYSEAEKLFKKVLESNEKTGADIFIKVNAFKNLLMLYLHQNLIEKGEELIASYNPKFEKCTSYDLAIGCYYLSSLQLDKAEYHFKKEIKLLSEPEFGLVKLGITYLLKGISVDEKKCPEIINYFKNNLKENTIIKIREGGSAEGSIKINFDLNYVKNDEYIFKSFETILSALQFKVTEEGKNNMILLCDILSSFYENPVELNTILQLALNNAKKNGDYGFALDMFNYFEKKFDLTSVFETYYDYIKNDPKLSEHLKKIKEYDNISIPIHSNFANKIYVLKISEKESEDKKRIIRQFRELKEAKKKYLLFLEGKVQTDNEKIKKISEEYIKAKKERDVKIKLIKSEFVKLAEPIGYFEKEDKVMMLMRRLRGPTLSEFNQTYKIDANSYTKQELDIAKELLLNNEEKSNIISVMSFSYNILNELAKFSYILTQTLIDEKKHEFSYENEEGAKIIIPTLNYANEVKRRFIDRFGNSGKGDNLLKLIESLEKEEIPRSRIINHGDAHGDNFFIDGSIIDCSLIVGPHSQDASNFIFYNKIPEFAKYFDYLTKKFYGALGKYFKMDFSEEEFIRSSELTAAFNLMMKIGTTSKKQNFEGAEFYLNKTRDFTAQRSNLWELNKAFEDYFINLDIDSIPHPNCKETLKKILF